MQVRPAEIIIIALLAIVLLCLAFLFYNQTLLREEIKTNQVAMANIPTGPTAVSLIPQPAVPTQTSPQPATPSTAVTQTPKQIQKHVPAKPVPSRPITPKTTTDRNPEFSGLPYPPRRVKPPAPAPSTPTTTLANEKAEEKALADYGPTVEQIITELYRGNYPAVLKKCTSDYANLVGPALASRMDEIRSRHGNLKAVMGRRLDDVDGAKDMKVFHFTVDTDKGKIVKFTVTVKTNDKKVAGLYFRQVPVGG